MLSPSLPEPLVIDSERTHRLWGGLGVLALAVVARLIALSNTDVIQRDGVRFIAIARALVGDPLGTLRANDWHLGYPALLVAVHEALSRVGLIDPAHLDGWERTGQLVSLVAGVLATLGVWALAGMAFNWRIAWAGAGMFAVGRKWTSLGADVMSDATAVCLLIWSVVAAVRCVGAGSHRAAAGWGTLAGALAGAAYLVRPEGLGAVAVAVGLLVISVLAGRMSARRALVGGLACVLTAAALAGPYMGFIGTLTRKKAVIAGAWVAPSQVPGADANHGGDDRDAFRASPFRPLLAVASPPVLIGTAATTTTDPASVQPASAVSGESGVAGGSPAESPVARARRAGVPAADKPTWIAVPAQVTEAAHPVVLGFACLWVAATVLHFALPPRLRKPYLRLPAGPAAIALGLMFGLYLAVVIWLHARHGYLDWRHCMPVAMALVPFAGAGAAAIVNLVAYAALPLKLKSVSVPLFINLCWMWGFLAMILSAGWQTPGPLHGGKAYVREAGDALAAAARPGEIAATNWRWVLHYAEVKGVLIDSSNMPADAVLARLESASPRPTLLALSDRMLADGEPRLTTLLVPPKFEPIGTFRQLPARGQEADEIRLYRIHWDPAPTGTK